MLRIGIIGCGAMGGRRADKLSQNANAELVAVCSCSEDKGAIFSTRHGGRVYTDWRLMLTDPDVDAVMVCTPNHRLSCSSQH